METEEWIAEQKEERERDIVFIGRTGTKGRGERERKRLFERGETDRQRSVAELPSPRRTAALPRRPVHRHGSARGCSTSPG